MLNLFNGKDINKIKEVLQQRHETIAIAESVTAGFIQAALSSAEKASEFFQGGLTAYNIGQKCRHLLIEPIHAQSCDCVSEQVATEMATNICTQFKSDWGLGITGYAAPVPESDNKLFAYYAAAYKGEVVFCKRVDAFKDETLTVQLFYVNELLKDFAAYLGKNKNP